MDRKKLSLRIESNNDSVCNRRINCLMMYKLKKMLIISFTLRNMSIIKWHKNQVNSICKRLGISAYGALWVSFLKGVIIGSTLIYLLN